MTLSIIIVSWNVKPLIDRCLSSIFRYKEGDYEVLAVDNASSDDSQEYLKNLAIKENHLKIILNDKNLGFAKGCNQALAQARGEFILFLNPDTEVKEGSLQKMVNFMTHILVKK